MNSSVPGRLVTVTTGDHCFKPMDAWTSNAIHFQNWMRNAPSPNARSRAGYVTVKYDCSCLTSVMAKSRGYPFISLNIRN